MTGIPPDILVGLPGGEYVAPGLADLAQGRESVPALVLAIASARLGEAGILLPPGGPSEPELRLYRLLRDQCGDEAHSQYNAHLRRLGSLCRALESRASTSLA